MTQFKLIWILILAPLSLFAQIRHTKIVIHAHDTLLLSPGDIIVADTLVMEDSSRIRLNSERTANYIRVKVALIGKHCVIDGKGVNGPAGRAGIGGRSANGPCRDGSHARAGSKGQDGTAGVNLFLYLDEIVVNGNLIIDLAGGNGGDGGNGGEGGGGSPGTLHCNGGDGGAGGDAGSGGDGGSGGTLTFGGADLEAMRVMLGAQIIVNTMGGNAGYGGIPGAGGSAGLGPGNKNGVAGASGRNGARGRPGSNGSIQFEQQ